MDHSVLIVQGILILLAIGSILGFTWCTAPVIWPPRAKPETASQKLARAAAGIALFALTVTCLGSAIAISQ